jgi:predicted nucleic acid-binding protein
MTAAEPAFVDTNVLVYANQRRAKDHERAVGWLDRLARESAVLWISRQILREYVAVVTRVQGDAPALPMSLAVQRVETFAARFEVAEDGPAIYDRWLELLQQVPIAGKQVHDANIVAAMLAHGITRLLTFNAADFRRFEPMITVLAP